MLSHTLPAEDGFPASPTKYHSCMDDERVCGEDGDDTVTRQTVLGAFHWNPLPWDWSAGGARVTNGLG